MEYQVVEAWSRGELERNVRHLILIGWVPLGGVDVSHYDGDPRRFFQAMVRQATTPEAEKGGGDEQG